MNIKLPVGIWAILAQFALSLNVYVYDFNGRPIGGKLDDLPRGGYIVRITSNLGNFETGYLKSTGDKPKTANHRKSVKKHEP